MCEGLEAGRNSATETRFCVTILPISLNRSSSLFHKSDNVLVSTWVSRGLVLSLSLGLLPLPFLGHYSPVNGLPQLRNGLYPGPQHIPGGLQGSRLLLGHACVYRSILLVSHSLPALLLCRTNSAGIWANVYPQTQVVYVTGNNAKTPMEIDYIRIAKISF